MPLWGRAPDRTAAATGQLKKPYVANATFNVLLWAVLGIAVEYLYAFQAWMFGDAADFVTILQKVLFDQFVWNPFMLAPVLFPLFMWRNSGFQFRLKVLDGFLLTYCSGMVTCWGTWIPGCSVVYAFPSVLQVPIFNIILFSYSILISLVSQKASPKTTSAEVANMGGNLPNPRFQAQVNSEASIDMKIEASAV
eukprot:CAMPEP_0115066492 /NCGR_PEP_ID=MMETSP0227-20121206/10835_1 /TAXON_ID=89957 /ORGANISM="Polarella glacialis, Strain CCMP 1383" /LENGTH=193 /DNA_ID=CAMNT_0002452395 /DNA_START=346 /DNA_END=928 /DNA_ORIENTATION=-